MAAAGQESRGTAHVEPARSEPPAQPGLAELAGRRPAWPQPQGLPSAATKRPCSRSGPPCAQPSLRQRGRKRARRRSLRQGLAGLRALGWERLRRRRALGRQGQLRGRPEARQAGPSPQRRRSRQQAGQEPARPLGGGGSGVGSQPAQRSPGSACSAEALPPRSRQQGGALAGAGRLATACSSLRGRSCLGTYTATPLP